jgi:tripartite-type tricarboxylate transporter receptor subunit TctC
MAPKGLPKPIFDKLHATLAKVVAHPGTREMMERQGGEPTTSTSEEMKKFIQEEYARFAQAIKLAKLKVE